jgi:anti-sigma regulatory factor (Ser/Thr protein kinase)
MMSPSSEFTEIVGLKEMPLIIDSISERMKELGAQDPFIFEMMTPVEEALHNIITHGYHGKKGEIKFQCKLNASGNALILTIKDKGDRFNPEKVPRQSARKRRTGRGHGLQIMRALTDKLTFGISKGFNTVTMEKGF